MPEASCMCWKMVTNHRYDVAIHEISLFSGIYYDLLWLPYTVQQNFQPQIDFMLILALCLY